MTPLDAALRYASWGWAVLPIQPGSKLPASAHGVKDASTDPAQIRAWFEGRDDLNVAVAAGRASNLICYDVDPRNGGDASWGAWLAMNGAHDDGPHQLTAGGGSHYLAQYDPTWRSSKLAQGVDLLSDGRYFLVYPSQIAGKKYEWEASSDPADGIAPFKIPAAWSAAYAAQAAKKPERVGDGGGFLPVGSRNAGLASLAGAMRAACSMSEAEMLAALSVANELRCNPPLPASEIAQICRSIASYPTGGRDVALDAAIGDAAAEALSIKPPPSDYHLEPASNWLAQPALPSWLIKGWLPDSGLAMLFGPSGAGKTFAALSMAACIASGKPWHGHKVAQGAVIYLAGEGHYGLRMRVAAWAQANGPEGLENLYISNRGIDLDAPQAAAEVIRAIKEPAPTKVSLVIIDTLATHFGGEENSARDTRQLLSAAQVIGRAYNCVVCLIHHTGLGPADRARGSSSLKAAMDWQMLLASGDDQITLSCTKAKDSEPPQPLACRLERVSLAGWQDDDGEGVSGAVFVVDGFAETKAKPKKDKPPSKHAKNLTLLEEAWRAGGCALGADGRPVVTRQVMIDRLVAGGFTQGSAEKMMQPSGGLCAALVNAQKIEIVGGIWTVCDMGLAGSWAMQLGTKNASSATE
jgi:AAA domain/Bifunctional DNA primase/polymerase, N-terminal/Primase C terminal 1 (PriCT-1)